MPRPPLFSMPPKKKAQPQPKPKLQVCLACRRRLPISTCSTQRLTAALLRSCPPARACVPNQQDGEFEYTQIMECRGDEVLVGWKPTWVKIRDVGYIKEAEWTCPKPANLGACAACACFCTAVALLLQCCCNVAHVSLPLSTPCR